MMQSGSETSGQIVRASRRIATLVSAVVSTRMSVAVGRIGLRSMIMAPMGGRGLLDARRRARGGVRARLSCRVRNVEEPSFELGSNIIQYFESIAIHCGATTV